MIDDTVRFQIINGRITSSKLTFNREELLLSANALFGAEQTQDLRDLIAEKIEDLRRYDVLAMEKVVAICCWGSSGSLLLASYLDGHEDVVMLPGLCGANIYRFFERYPSLPLRDRLLGYPAFQQFFEGDFAISPAQYYAAVQAILDVYGEWPQEFLESRRTFFLFVHVAYNLALGRCPANSRSLIVHAQHDWDNALARRLFEDFPRAKFIHTIRDPIALSDRMSDGWLAETELPPPQETQRDRQETRSAPKNPFSVVASRCAAAFQKLVDLPDHSRFSFLYLINRDQPHLGMESRTQAVRFEDLHCDTVETMRDLSEWLGLSYQATLLDSTFNGIPYVVTRNGTAWSGRRPQQAQRNLRIVSGKDRALLFSLFYENFVAWNYSCPRKFGNPIVRCIVFFSLFLVPMRMEILAARALFKRRILPSVRHGNISIAIKSLLRILFYRLTIILLLAPEFFRRRIRGKTLLQVDDRKRRPEQAR